MGGPGRQLGTYYSVFVCVLVGPLSENGKNLSTLKLQSERADDLVVLPHADSVPESHSMRCLEGLTWLLNQTHWTTRWRLRSGHDRQTKQI